jgi:hypothetical protein
MVIKEELKFSISAPVGRHSKKESHSWITGRDFIRLRRRSRLRAETVACMGPFGEDRHFGVQARALPVGLHNVKRFYLSMRNRVFYPLMSEILRPF